MRSALKFGKIRVFDDLGQTATNYPKVFSENLHPAKLVPLCAVNLFVRGQTPLERAEERIDENPKTLDEQDDQRGRSLHSEDAVGTWLAPRGLYFGPPRRRRTSGKARRRLSPNR